MEPGQGITTLRWGNEEETEILLGRNDNVIQVYDLPKNTFTLSKTIPEGAVVGVCRVDGKIIGAAKSGQIHILGKGKEIQTLTAGTDISQMRQCKDNQRLLATGGKDRKNNLKVWNIEQETPIFSSKNVPHDSLQLEVPVWDSDIGFLDCNNLVTASRYGYIRTYDIRKQRRPVHQFVPKDKELMAFTCLKTYDNIVYVGLTTGGIRAFDTRSLKFPIHTYKGSIGSITDLTIDKTGKFLCSTSLERYVRIHSTIDNTILYQCYVKTKPSQVLIKTAEEATNGATSANEEAAQDLQESKINAQEIPSDEEEEDEIVTEYFHDDKPDKLLKRLKRKRKFSN